MSDKTLRAALADLHDQLRQLLHHPDVTSQDKASIVLASTNLSEIERRHMGRWTPCNPATLPPRKAGQKFPALPAGRLVDWERDQEVANA